MPVGTMDPTTNGEAAGIDEVPTKAKKQPEPREYVILNAGSDATGDGVWLEIGRGKGLTAKAATADLVGTLSEDKRDGTFVAVPVRSFVPITRKTETVTKASWS